MTGDKNKDIVEEVFGRSTNVDDRVSALFAGCEHHGQVSLEEGQEGPSDLKGSPAAEDTDCLGNKPLQSAAGARREPGGERTTKNRGLIRRVKIVVAAGLAVCVLVFFGGSYLKQRVNASTKLVQEKQYVNRSEMVNPEIVDPQIVSPEIVSPLESEPLLDAPPESVGEKINEDSMSVALDVQPVIDWGSLLDEISATIPRTVQLNVIESGEAGEMFLEGEALSTDTVYSFMDSLRTNWQVESAELSETGTVEGESEETLTFSIRCSLVSHRRTPGSVDGDYDDSGLDRDRLFAPKEAAIFFDSLRPVLEDTGCTVKSLLVLPKDAVFEVENTNGRITKRHASLTLLGGYQDILKAVEKLQNRSQDVWLDSVSIKQSSGAGGLECSLDISVYVAEGSG